MRYFNLAVALATLYLLLTWNFEPVNILLGLLLGLGIAVLIRPERGAFDIKRLPGTIYASIRYLVIIFYDLLVSGFQVAGIVLRPSLPVQPGIIAIPSGSESELATALSAHAITLTPGELVVEIGDHGVMYTHTLDATHPEEDAREAQTLRRDLLDKIFA